MQVSRRAFLRNTVLAGFSSALDVVSAGGGSVITPATSEPMGVLTDISLCIGCRRCEWACNNEPSNDFDQHPPMNAFNDFSVFADRRVHSSDSLTVVNQFGGGTGEPPSFVKFQCMHCLDPACASACLVNAFERTTIGAVTYNAWRCMGCRYCMIACPFQIPSYEYSKPLTPRVRKCTLCFQERTSKGKSPACVEVCPVQCLTFGNRAELIRSARTRILSLPGYVNHIYGENEMGGTSWLYISKAPFERLGFQTLPSYPPPRLVEGIQHSIFRYFIGPMMLYGMLSAIMWNFRETPDDSTRGKSREANHD